MNFTAEMEDGVVRPALRMGGGPRAPILLDRRNPELARVRSAIEAVASGAYPDVDASFAVSIARAVHEALTNILRHTRPHDPDSPIEVRTDPGAREFVVEVLHGGGPFQPEAAALPDMATYPPGGFGLYIVEHSVDEVSYTSAPDGRSLIRLVKRVP